jgi:eukaryotic-like serine/threonine-protein kinase
MQPGHQLAPHLKLLAQLGEGGMGTVWTAEHDGLKTKVAVKLLNAEAASTPEAVERFRREAAIAASVKNPHIVQQLDVGVAATGEPYIVMELLEGEDLETRLARDNRLPLHVVSDIVKQVCRALEAAHAAGIAHRDIKPANLFLVDNSGDLFIKVLDFGVAKTLVQQDVFRTQEGSTIGTPAYMSPEQLFGHTNLDGRTDLWATACVAYEAITGVLPFPGSTLAAIGAAMATKTLVPPSAYNGLVPPEVDAWFARALAYIPDARFVEAREFSHAFSVAMNHAAPVAGGAAPALSPRPAQSARSIALVQTAPLVAKVHTSMALAPTLPPDAVADKKVPPIWIIVPAVAACVLAVALLGYVVFRDPASVTAATAATAGSSNAPMPASSVSASADPSVAADPSARSTAALFDVVASALAIPETSAEPAPTTSAAPVAGNHSGHRGGSVKPTPTTAGRGTATTQGHTAATASTAAPPRKPPPPPDVAF